MLEYVSTVAFLALQNIILKFTLMVSGYEKSAQPVVQLTSHISPPPVRTPERIPKPVVPKKQKALKMQQKYEKKQKYQTKKVFKYN